MDYYQCIEGLDWSDLDYVFPFVIYDETYLLYFMLKLNVWHRYGAICVGALYALFTGSYFTCFGLVVGMFPYVVMRYILPFLLSKVEIPRDNYIESILNGVIYGNAVPFTDQQIELFQSVLKDLHLLKFQYRDGKYSIKMERIRDIPSGDSDPLM